MTCPGGKQRDYFQNLCIHHVCMLFSRAHDTPRHPLNNPYSVSKVHLERIRGCAELWEYYVKQDFPHADAQTLQLAKTRALHHAALRGDAATSTTEWIMYGVLARQRSCQRCQLDYCDGNNTPHSCRFHTGVLFSGGRLNGNGLVWSCCNKRSYHTTTFQRHVNGCTASRHVGGAGRSLWTTDGAVSVEEWCSRNVHVYSVCWGCLLARGIAIFTKMFSHANHPRYIHISSGVPTPPTVGAQGIHQLVLQ